MTSTLSRQFVLTAAESEWVGGMLLSFSDSSLVHPEIMQVTETRSVNFS